MNAKIKAPVIGYTPRTRDFPVPLLTINAGNRLATRQPVARRMWLICVRDK